MSNNKLVIELLQYYKVAKENHKRDMKDNCKLIPNYSNMLLYKMDSLRYTLMKLKWHSCDYNNLTIDEKKILWSYFNIYDNDSFREKLMDILKWMD